MMIFGRKNVLGARQKGRPRKTWKEVVGKDVNELKPSDAMEHNKWRKMIGGNWSDRSSDSDAESCRRIERF